MEIESHKRKMFIFGGIILGIMLFALDNMIITPSIPRILREIGGVAHINWVFTAYLLTSTITTPIYGKLTDIFSRKRMFLIAIGIFVVASMLCGLSQNIFQLIGFRALQGIGGGGIMVSAISMIGEIFSLKERAKYQGYIGAVFAIASLGGPVLGGYITDAFSWRWTFLINLLVGLIAFVVLFALLPKSLHQEKKARVDYVGAVLLSLFLMPLILLFSSIKVGDLINTESIALLIASIIMFVAFYKYEKRKDSPILSMDLFKDRRFLIPAIMTFANAILLFAATLYIQIYAQGVLHMSISSSGLLLTAMMIPLTISSPLYGQMVSRTGKYKKIVVFGAIMLVIGTLWFSYMLHGTTNVRDVVIHLLPIGIGLGAMMSIFNMIIQMVYPREMLGEVTGALQLVRGIGGTFGTALLGFVFGFYVKDLTADGSMITQALIVIFYILAGFSVLSLISAFFMKEGEGVKHHG
ncbi:MAG: drug resistance transporter, EmrB/QacA subfamily [Candidatus Nomurabacteria bacterium]|nr:drug resistance transporter, EmrB/QacA subfamily [Candidatus Nomurabacteria bacterium]